MKNVICILLFPIILSAQSEKVDTSSIYIGMYLSTLEGNFGFVQFENDIGKAILRCEYLTDFEQDHRLYVKMEFQVYRRNGFRFFVGLPPFHWTSIGRGYNTPLNFEVLFKNKLIFNIDIYRNNVNASVQFRYKF